VNAASGLTVPAEIIVTVAVGLAGTAMVTHDVVNVASTAVISSQSASERGLVVSATDTIAAYPELGLPVIELNKSNSRWYGYVSRRLRDLHDARYDFTGFRVPQPEVIDRARFVANYVFKPEHPTPSVVPSEDGDVLFVWHKAGWDLEIDVGLEEISVWAHERSTGRDWYGSLEELRAPAVRLLDWLAWR